MAKKQFSRLGFGVLTILLSASVFQAVAAVAAVLVWPDEGTRPGWLMWAATFAPMYLLAVPLGLLVMRKAPATPRQQHPMTAKEFVTAGLISVFLMYAGNIIGSVILTVIQAVAGTTAENPLLTYAMDDNLLLRVLVMVVIAPVIEEYIFRKQLIDRMNAYGEKLAVVTSALIFGLFHGNLSQFFYAFALGLVFGYVYLRTGRLRYSAALHMFINFLGSVVAPAVLASVDVDAVSSLDFVDFEALAAYLVTLVPLMVYGLVMFGLVIAGLVLFCLNVRKTSFDPAPMELERSERFKTAFLNPGMILFAILCLASIVLTFLV